MGTPCAKQSANFGRNQLIGTVACQGDDTPCVLRPYLLRPWVSCAFERRSASHCVACRESDPGHRLIESGGADRQPVFFGEVEQSRLPQLDQ